MRDGVNLLIRNAEIGPDRFADVRFSRGGLTEFGTSLHRCVGEELIDAAGKCLLPGLHDHHVHLRAQAAEAASVNLGPLHVANRAGVTSTLRAAASRTTDWVRGVGYHESVAGPLDAAELDRMVPHVPLRIQHRSGAMWMFNSAAIAVTGLAGVAHAGIERDAAGKPTGRLRRMDAWVRSATPALLLDYKAIGSAAAAAGVTGFSDATPFDCASDVSDLVAAVAAQDLPQTVWMMGSEVPAAPGIERGPVKVILDENDLPELQSLAARITEARMELRGVALHCLTRAELVLALLALETAGGRLGYDRLEHAALLPRELFSRLRATGTAVVTQPHFISERGDTYITELEDDDLRDLYRLRSIRQTGIGLAAGTDAPYGDRDPWRSIAAACERRTVLGKIIGSEERLEPREAVELFLGDPRYPGQRRQLRHGAREFVLLVDGLTQTLKTRRDSSAVALTAIDGQIAYDTR